MMAGARFPRVFLVLGVVAIAGCGGTALRPAGAVTTASLPREGARREGFGPPPRQRRAEVAPAPSAGDLADGPPSESAEVAPETPAPGGGAPPPAAGDRAPETGVRPTRSPRVSNGVLGAWKRAKGAKKNRPPAAGALVGVATPAAPDLADRADLAPAAPPPVAAAPVVLVLEGLPAEQPARGDASLALMKHLGVSVARVGVFLGRLGAAARAPASARPAPVLLTGPRPRPEVTALAASLRSAGVRVAVEVYDAAVHGPPPGPAGR